MNIGDLNYTDGEQKLQEIKPISEPFCDNIMVIKIKCIVHCTGDINEKKNN